MADYLLQAMGIDVLTHGDLQADIMNGVDPAPQDISSEQGLLVDHKVKVFCYNQQVVDASDFLVQERGRDGRRTGRGRLRDDADPGYDYQSWMLAEVNRSALAVANGKSTEHL